LVSWSLSPRVGNVKNNDPSLAEPINLRPQGNRAIPRDIQGAYALRAIHLVPGNAQQIDAKRGDIDGGARLGRGDQIAL
jgi:hypothetical protein